MPIAESHRPRSRGMVPDARRPARRGALPSPRLSPGPVVALMVAAGLVLCVLCENASRETLHPDPWIYWAGILLIVVPIVFRVTAFNISSLERTLLVVLEGLALYAARMMRDPYGFSLGGEFAQALNLQSTIASHHLYHADALGPVLAHYPGLTAASSAIASLTGMSSWGSGVLVIGAARVTLMLGLYVLFSAVSRSARAGALGGVLFAANGNYLVGDGAYTAGSLALALTVVALAALAERHRGAVGPAIGAWSTVATLALFAIIPTQALAADALVGVLWLMCLGRVWLAHPSPRAATLGAAPPLWPFALVATVLTAAWLIIVASQTAGHLSLTVGSAFLAPLRAVTEAGTSVAPLAGVRATIGLDGPLSEELTCALRLLLLLLVIPFGLRATWRGRQSDPFAWGLAILAVAFFGLTILCLVPGASEIASDAANLTFLGVAFLAGATAMPYLRRFWRFRRARAAIALAVGLCVVGGALAGRPAGPRLALPTFVTAANGTLIPSPSVAVARWFATQGPGGVLAAPADAELIDLDGHHVVDADASRLLSGRSLDAQDVRMLDAAHVRYVVVDARRSSQNADEGLYFDLRRPAGATVRVRLSGGPRGWTGDGAPVYDSGDIVVYDLDRPR